MKILFLDIDGVLNSRQFVYRQRAKDKNYRLWLDTDPIAVALVQRIIRETKCKVVLSSTWRHYPEARKHVTDNVCRFIDVTKDLNNKHRKNGVDRGYEIDEWLSRHPSVTKYAILDDDSDFFPFQWLFKTTFKDGLTPEIAQAVIDHLNAGEGKNVY